MRKILAFMLVLCMIFAFSACGEEEQTSLAQSTVSSVESKAESTVSSVESKVESVVESKVESTVSSKPEPEVVPNQLEQYKKAGQLTRAIVLDSFKQESFTSSTGTVVRYSIYIPSNYDKSKKYPLVTFLHGAGERGYDNKKQLNNMVWELFDYSIEEMSNAIVIAPQCLEGEQWVDTPWANGNYSPAAVAESDELGGVVELIKWINSNYSTNTKRQYAIGLSMGGFGVWDLIMRHTEMFTAAVPVCGGADPAMASKLKNFPVYTLHGDADPTVPVAGTRAMAQALKDAGNTVYRYDEVPGGQHNVWTHAATSTDAVKWMFSKTKK